MQRAACRRSQRGVALVFGAIAIVAGLAALGLAIDLGRLYFERRDLQRLANIAALDAARLASGCVEPVDNRSDVAAAEALASVLRNGGRASDLPVGAVTTGRLVTGADRVRRFEPAEDDNDYAVEVRVSRDAPSRLLPMSTGTGTPLRLSAVAAAQALPVASVSVGSSLAEINSPLLNELLADQLGSSPGIDALTYRGLFNATVDLGLLMAELGVATPQALLAASVPTQGFLNAVAEALSEGTDAAARGALEAVADSSDGGGSTVPGDVIGVPPGFEEPAEQALVNAGALVEAVAQSSNGDDLLVVPLPVSIPGVTGAGEITSRLIQRALPVTGPAGNNAAGEPVTVARNAQLAAQGVLPLLPILGTPAQLRFWAQAAQATAEIADIECSRRGRPHPTVTVRARTSLARIGLGRFDDINAPNPAPQPAPLATLNLAGQTIRILVSGFVNVGTPQTVDLVYDGPFDTPQTQTVGVLPGAALAAATDSLANNLSITVEVAGGGPLNLLASLALQPVLAALPLTLAPILRQLDEQVFAPALEPLGVTLGGAEITVSDVREDPPFLFLR